jgi:hypothetical protein
MLPVAFMDPSMRRFLRHIALLLMREPQSGESGYVVEAVFAALPNVLRKCGPKRRRRPR